MRIFLMLLCLFANRIAHADLSIREGGNYSIDIQRTPVPTKAEAMRNFLVTSGFTSEQSDAAMLSIVGLPTAYRAQFIHALKAYKISIMFDVLKIGGVMPPSGYSKFG